MVSCKDSEYIEVEFSRKDAFLSLTSIPESQFEAQYQSTLNSLTKKGFSEVHHDRLLFSDNVHYTLLKNPTGVYGWLVVVCAQKGFDEVFDDGGIERHCEGQWDRVRICWDSAKDSHRLARVLPLCINADSLDITVLNCHAKEISLPRISPSAKSLAVRYDKRQECVLDYFENLHLESLEVCLVPLSKRTLENILSKSLKALTLEGYSAAETSLLFETLETNKALLNRLSLTDVAVDKSRIRLQSLKTLSMTHMTTASLTKLLQNTPDLRVLTISNPSLGWMENLKLLDVLASLLELKRLCLYQWSWLDHSRIRHLTEVWKRKNRNRLETLEFDRLCSIRLRDFAGLTSDWIANTITEVPYAGATCGVKRLVRKRYEVFRPPEEEPVEIFSLVWPFCAVGSVLVGMVLWNVRRSP